MMESSRQKRKREKSITTPDGPLKQLDIINKDQTVFSTLPNEVILHMFSYLKIVDLQKCGQVSKRFRAISNEDQYLWPKKLNLCYKKVPVGFMKKLLESGCKHLSLSEAILEGTLNLPKASKLQHLNLCGVGLEVNRENSEKLLESCYSLQKLSLSKFKLSWKQILAILQNGKTLKVLDLSRCTFCICEKNCTVDGAVPIKKIVENCKELEELCLHKTGLHETSIDFFVSNLTSKIQKLDLFGMSHLRDEHVKVLATRCQKITELNLGGWNSGITKKSLSLIIEHLKLTLVKLNLEFTEVRFDLSDLVELKNMKKLKFLHYDHGEETLLILWKLEQLMPNLKINSKYVNTRIASPRYPEDNPCQGFWEIKAEREELLIAYFSSQFLQNQYLNEFVQQPCRCGMKRK